MTRDVKATELNIAAALQEAAGALAEAARSLSLGQGSLTQTYRRPQSDWLPWHVARFCFLPRFADPKKSFATEIRLLVERCAGRGHSFTFDVEDPSRCVVLLGQVALTVDSADGQFSIEAIGDEDDFWPPVTVDMRDPSGLPEEFFARCAADDLALKPEYERDAELLIELSHKLWSSMREGFRLALRSGNADVFGRWQSISNELLPISVDQLLEFAEPEVSVIDENDWLSDYDRRTVIKDPVSDSVVAFSLYVAPQVSRGRSKGSKGEDAATDELADEMRANPDRPRRKADVRQEYVKRFGITPQGFNDRIWPTALQLVPRTAWGRSGRPPRQAMEMGLRAKR